MLGHTDAGFTMNTYMHVTDSMQENVANAMGNLLGGTQQIHKWSIDGLERKIE
jgi:L-asparaginase II